MLTLNDTAITILASIAMIAAFLVALLPVVPGPVMLWGIALVYAWATGFRFVGVLGMGIITVLALIASLSDFWLPIIGVKTEGGSCRSVTGTLIGGILGTFLIPVPVLGTLIGSMIGAAALEFLYLRSLHQAGSAARFAFKNFMYSFAVELMANVLIVLVFFASVLIN